MMTQNITAHNEDSPLAFAGVGDAALPWHGAAKAVVAPEPGAVLSKATLRAAAALGVTNRALALIVGVSEATVSRMQASAWAFQPGTKPFELAALFVRFFRDLDGLVSGDEKAARSWLNGPNTVLGGTPAILIQTIPGLMNAIAYLDRRLAPA